jgi:hypothetical protein
MIMSKTQIVVAAIIILLLVVVGIWHLNKDREEEPAK